MLTKIFSASFSLFQLLSGSFNLGFLRNLTTNLAPTRTLTVLPFPLLAFDLRTFSCSAPFRLRYGFVTSNLEKIPSKMRLVAMLRLPTPKHTLPAPRSLSGGGSLPVPCRNLNRNLFLNHLHPLITYRGKPRQTRPNRGKQRFIK
jgi:hypothetical protein